MRKGLAIGILLVSASRPALAEDRTLATLQAQDAQCFAYSAILAGKDDENMKASGQASMPYFLGKLTARDPDLDMEQMLERASQGIAAHDPADGARRCGDEIKQRFAQIAAASAAMKSGARPAQ